MARYQLCIIIIIIIIIMVDEIYVGVKSISRYIIVAWFFVKHWNIFLSRDLITECFPRAKPTGNIQLYGPERGIYSNVSRKIMQQLFCHIGYITVHMPYE